MTDLLIYLLKVALAVTLVTIPYYLWLRQDAALIIKRIYLAGGIVLAWLFPMIRIRKPEMISTLTKTYFIDPDAVEAPVVVAVQQGEAERGISIFAVILIVYLLGLILLTTRHFILFRKLRNMERKTDNSDKQVVYTNTSKAFTFFRKIFIPDDLQKSSDINSILIHEKAHLQQLHMIDLIIAESNLLLTWFNPFSWLISRMIKENHEHLADRAVLSKGINPAHYKAQLLNHATGVELFSIANQFNHSLTKKRFQMMKTIKSPKKGYIKYLALVPVLVIALLLFTAANTQLKTINGKVVSSVDGDALPGTSIIISGTTSGTVSDIEGKFSIRVDGNPELVFSFVGFKTTRIPAKEAAKKDVVLYPSAFEMDLKDVEAKEPKHLRSEVHITKSEFESDRITFSTSTGEDISIDEAVFVVDGEVVENLESIPSEDIAEISIIKAPDAPELKKYNAKNGLVMVTTKKGAKTLKKQETLKDDKEVFYIVEEIPSFPGGREVLKGYIYQNLEYPEEAMKKGLSGTVYVEFLVTGKGVVTDVSVKESTNKLFNEAAVNVFREMPLWEPGKQRGKPVSAKVIVPVRFGKQQD